MNRRLSSRGLPSCSLRRYVQRRPIQSHTKARRGVLLNSVADQGYHVRWAFVPRCICCCLKLADKHRRHDRYVALKILKADSNAAGELRMLHHIVKTTGYSRYIIPLLDEFDHQGSNGLHRCLVFEPMGPTVDTMVEELSQFMDDVDEDKMRHSPKMTKSILRQSLQGTCIPTQSWNSTRRLPAWEHAIWPACYWSGS
jgi:hypothetical protein